MASTATTYRNPVDKFIAELGGTSYVAQQLGLRASTVSSWRTAGNIPNWRVAPVAEIAARKGVPWPQVAA